MTLRHIRIFLAVCENGNNTTRAARALYLAQPAVSRAVAELEEYYGVRLFDRIGRRLYLTEAGRRMWEYAVHICGLFDDLEKGLRGWDEQGVLRVGASITIGSPVMWTHSARHTPGWMCASGWGRRSSLRKSCCTTRWTSL